MSNTFMRLRLIIYACTALMFAGCTERSSDHIGGPYYFETTKHENILSEPGGGLEFKLVHKKDGKITVISDKPLAANNPFQWHVYGGNLAFIEGASSYSRLVLFSERKGNTILKQDAQYPPWQTTADDRGVTCQFLDEEMQPTNYPPPIFYSAEYLKGL